jgi:HIV-1 Vpr-binding protein
VINYDSYATFSPCDELVLYDTHLWDPRSNHFVHKFDNFSSYGHSAFHPNGNELIINSEIWDIRTFKLLKTCPALDRSKIHFNPLGDVIYASMYKLQDHNDIH